MMYLPYFNTLYSFILRALTKRVRLHHNNTVVRSERKKSMRTASSRKERVARARDYLHRC